MFLSRCPKRFSAALVVVVLFVASSLVLSSCREDLVEQSKLDYQKYSEHIARYPSASISRCDDIAILLTSSLPDQELPPNLFEVFPPVGGTPVLSKNRYQISLRGATFKHNVSYTVRFRIGLLYEMPSDMDVFTFPVEVQQQSFALTMDPPINQSMEVVSYSGEINYATCEPNPELIQECLTATQEGKPLQIKWTRKSTGKAAFRIEEIQRGKEASTVDLQLSMETLNAKEQSALKLQVPSQSDFSLHAVKAKAQDHLLTLTFTDPIMQNQHLEGLIEVKGRLIQQIKVVSNQVLVFFSDKNYGYFDLVVLPGIKNIAGYELKDHYEQEVFFNPPIPKVSIAERGNILPPSGGWEVPVRLVSATGFRLRVLKIYEDNIHRLYQENGSTYESQTGLENIGRLVLDTTYATSVENVFEEHFHAVRLDDLVKQESGAMYKILLTIPRVHNAYPCRSIEGQGREDAVDRIDFDRPWVSMRYGYGRYGINGNNYYYQVGRTYYSDAATDGYRPCSADFDAKILDARLLMCSDVGVVTKWQPATREYLVFTSKISSASALPGATIKLYNYQGAELATNTTSHDGVALLRVEEEVPFMLAATFGRDVTYLELRDAKSLSMSTFNVEGKKWHGHKKVFFYGDRGVWRPGDTVFINAMVHAPEGLLPEALPVTLELYDPTNKLVRTWVEKVNVDGIYKCHFSTDLDAPTGKWRLEMSLGGKVYQTYARIETVRPNRLKMHMDFADSECLKHNQSLEAPLTVKWMHGMPAKEVQADISMYQRLLAQPFGPSYANYVFDNMEIQVEEDVGVVMSGKTSKEGKLDYTIGRKKGQQYPGVMLFNFEIRAFEHGGAFSTDMKAVKYSPYPFYVGAKFPGGDTDGDIYLKSDEAIMLAVLNEKGKPVSKKVKVTLEKIDHNWWYQFGTIGDYSALYTATKEQVDTYEVQVDRAGSTLSLGRKGRFLLTIKEVDGGHSMSRVVYAYGDEGYSDSEEVSQLEVLPLQLERDQYTVGDVLDFELPPMTDGQFLVTVETGGKILHHEVRSAKKDSKKVSFEVSPEMVPTAFIHVHFIQPWSTYDNHRPLRLFTVKPISVFDASTVLHPVIEIDSLIEEGRHFEVEISEKEGKEMSYTLAIVDEGLLDLTQFRTPDPWSQFFGKEALEVKTWDMYREIFKRFLGEYTSLLAVGGDGSSSIQASAKARRFRPVVKFVGPVSIKPGEQKRHQFRIDNYVGAVRVMVVASNAKAVGHAAERVAVKKPLMLYATLPRVLGPQEQIKVPVTVFAMDPSIKRVKAQIVTDDLVEVVGSDEQEVFFEEPGEKDIHFLVQTAEQVGVSKIQIRVQAGKEAYSEHVEVNLRPSAPPSTQVHQELIEPKRRNTIAYEVSGVKGSNAADFSVSRALNFSFKSEVDWLLQYPHGCLEQTISKAFPQIYLAQMELLDDMELLRCRQHVSAVIQKLRFMQLPNGAFSYWPGATYPNAWGTSYALHFLVEAEKLGYNVPKDMIEKGVRYEYKRASSSDYRGASPGSSRDRRTIAMAYRLQILALAGKPNYSAMNRLRLAPSLHNTAKWILASAFHTVGEEKLVSLVLEDAVQNTEKYRDLSGTFGSEIRDQAIIARVLISLEMKKEAKVLMDEIVKKMKQKDEYLSTQDRAQVLMTMSQLVENTSSHVNDTAYYDVVLSEDVTFKEEQVTLTPNHYHLSEKDLSGSIAIVNHSDSDLYSTLILKGQPLRDESATASHSLDMSVVYHDMQGQEIDPKQLAKGQDFVVSYTVVHPGTRQDYENLALTAIFPSGWEMINERLRTNSTFDQGDPVDYIDIRDDRVNLYFDLEKGGKKQFNFRVNATYEGKYWAPPAACEAMYDGTIYSKSQGLWTTVQ